MLELPIPSTFSAEQSAVVGESVGARGRTSNYAYKSKNNPYHVFLNYDYFIELTFDIETMRSV